MKYTKRHLNDSTPGDTTHLTPHGLAITSAGAPKSPTRAACVTVVQTLRATVILKPPCIFYE
jgi:hypothetical protein